MQTSCATVSMLADVRLVDVDDNGWQILEPTGTLQFECSCGHAARGPAEAIEPLARPHFWRAATRPRTLS